MLNHFSDKTLAQYNIPQSVSEHAQGIFVEIRKAEHDVSKEVKTNADTFHQWLTHSRLMAVSEGKLELTAEIFDKVRTMETQRLARLITSK